MEGQVSLPNVSIPCHDEQREGKRKRFTVRVPAGSSFLICFLPEAAGFFVCLFVFVSRSLVGSIHFSFFFQVYKVIVSVRRQEWFVFRRYAEFDKLHNTVSPHNSRQSRG